MHTKRPGEPDVHGQLLDTFNGLLHNVKDVENLLSGLSKDIAKGKGVQDPDIETRKEILAKLHPLIHRLRKEWPALHTAMQDSMHSKDPRITRSKKIFYSTMQRIKSIVTTTSSLTIATESTYQIDTQLKETSIDLGDRIALNDNDITAFDNKISEIIQRYDALRKNIRDVAILEFARNLSIYLTYFITGIKGIITVFLAWGNSLSKAIEIGGRIFYPIIATFNTTAALFRLCSRIFQWGMAYTEAEKAGQEATKKQELERVKLLLRESIFFRSLIFTLNGLSILAFAGILSMPLSWVFVAAATLIDWIDNGVGGYRRAKAGLEMFFANNANMSCYDNQTTKEILAVLKIKKGIPPCSPLVKEEIDKLELLLVLREKIDTTRVTAQWGLLGVISMILIACGPIPVAGLFLGYAGLAIMGIDVGVTVGSYAKPYLTKWFGFGKKDEGATNGTGPQTSFKVHVALAAERRKGYKNTPPSQTIMPSKDGGPTVISKKEPAAVLENKIVENKDQAGCFSGLSCWRR